MWIVKLKAPRFGYLGSTGGQNGWHSVESIEFAWKFTTATEACELANRFGGRALPAVKPAITFAEVFLCGLWRTGYIISATAEGFAYACADGFNPTTFAPGNWKLV